MATIVRLRALVLSPNTGACKRTLPPCRPRADSKMFELEDSIGRKLFESIQITLVCDDCLKTDHPEKCTHKLHGALRKREA